MTPKQNVYKVTFRNASLGISETIEVMAPSEIAATLIATDPRLGKRKPGYKLESVVMTGAQG